MNKAKIDSYIQPAYQALLGSGIAKGDKMPKTFRGYISSFGAAITMGSLRAAIAFYSSQGSASREREVLVKVIYALIKGADISRVSAGDLFAYVQQQNNDSKCKEEIYNAAIAVKLAMNMFVLE